MSATMAKNWINYTDFKHRRQRIRHFSGDNEIAYLDITATEVYYLIVDFSNILKFDALQLIMARQFLKASSEPCP